jgi:hypothetical protein
VLTLLLQPAIGYLSNLVGGLIMRLFKYVAAAASAIALGGSAVAATVTSIEGRLQINTGSGYHTVSGTTEAKPGASVMVGPGGKAEILYADGCRTPVTPGAVAVVAPVSPCAQGQADQDQGYTYGWLVLGVGAAIGLSCAGFWCGQHGGTVVSAPAPASP